MAELGKLAGVLATTVALAGNPQAQEAADFSGLVKLDKPEVTAVINDTRTHVLLAQANIEDGRRGPYIALIPQVNDGKIIKVKFYRDKDGAIIPPDVVDGKLLDGSDAPTHPLRAKNAQVKILAKYDPLILVKAERKDMAIKANEELGRLVTLMEQSKLDRKGLYSGFLSVFTVTIWLGNNANQKDIDGMNIVTNTLEKYGRVVLKINQSEIETIKKQAEKEAQDRLNSFSPSAA